jgi:PqqD family protein of HPr-rel-A system
MAGPVYIADPAAELERVALDGLVLIFHAPSGITHIVAMPAPEILDALGEGPADAAELLRRLAAHFDIEADGGEAIQARLGELEAAGLVRRG